MPPGPDPDPVPIKSVMLFDVHGLWGGRNVWISDEGETFVQTVGRDPREPSERRHSLQLTKGELSEMERLVGANRFLDLSMKHRTGVPDEAASVIAVIAKSGRQNKVMKWHKDPNAQFDPLYHFLRRIAVKTSDSEPVHKGKFDWDWHPEGFPSLKEVMNWEK